MHIHFSPMVLTVIKLLCADVIDERKTKEKINTTEKEIRTKENLEAKN